jgi:putative tryptophan/tyrosine transport system substrate-binding protein
MRRRMFIAGLTSSIAAGRVTSVFAQQPRRRPLVGFLVYSTPERDPNTQAVLQGLQQIGYVAGQNITIEFRGAQGRPERLPELAADLVSLRPDVIVALAGDVVPAVAKATQTIPVIYAMSSDPVLGGLAASLAKPGGNLTGVTFLQDHLAGKRLEVFKEAAARLSRVGVIKDLGHADNELIVAERAAGPLNLRLELLEMREPADLDRVLESATKASVDGLYVVSSRHTVINAQRIVAFAKSNRLPLVGGWGTWVQAGALASYGPNVTEMVRQVATYVDKVLKGAMPGELPVQQPTRFELMFNLREAKALGITIPPSLLARADEVIE